MESQGRFLKNGYTYSICPTIYETRGLRSPTVDLLGVSELTSILYTVLGTLVIFSDLHNNLSIVILHMRKLRF